MHPVVCAPIGAAKATVTKKLVLFTSPFSGAATKAAILGCLSWSNLTLVYHVNNRALLALYRGKTMLYKYFLSLRGKDELGQSR